jgi:guanine deaminase
MWAHLDEVFYAATYEDVKKYGEFTDSDYMAELMKPESDRVVPAYRLMRQEAVEVWKKFAEMPDKCHY